MKTNPQFAEDVCSQSTARTESNYLETVVDGFRVESVRRAADFMAWINGDRKCWGAGRTRGQAIDSAVLTAKSFQDESSAARTPLRDNEIRPEGDN